MCFLLLPMQQVLNKAVQRSHVVCLWVGTFPLTERHISYWLQPLPNFKWVIFEINVGQTGSRRAPKSVCLCFPRLRLCRWSPGGAATPVCWWSSTFKQQPAWNNLIVIPFTWGVPKLLSRHPCVNSISNSCKFTSYSWKIQYRSTYLLFIITLNHIAWSSVDGVFLI